MLLNHEKCVLYTYILFQTIHIELFLELNVAKKMFLSHGE